MNSTSSYHWVELNLKSGLHAMDLAELAKFMCTRNMSHVACFNRSNEDTSKDFQIRHCCTLHVTSLLPLSLPMQVVWACSLVPSPPINYLCLCLHQWRPRSDFILHNTWYAQSHIHVLAKLLHTICITSRQMNANVNLQCIQILFVGSVGEPWRPGRGTGGWGSASSGGSSG